MASLVLISVSTGRLLMHGHMIWISVSSLQDLFSLSEIGVRQVFHADI